MANEIHLCNLCLNTKSTHKCGICDLQICKSCTEYVNANTFSFMSRVPTKLLKTNYCLQCYDSEILPEKIKYNSTLEKAEEIYFLTKNYGGYIRVLKRHTGRVKVEACEDRRETIMRLAFFAAELGLNAIIESEVESTKVRKSGYQSKFWSGSALPAQIDSAQLERSSLRRV